jgi:hypothetical protein
MLTQALPAGSPEGVVNAITEYMVGLSDGIARTSPELIFAMSEEIETALCEGGKTADSMQMVYARMFRSIPELATARSFDCFFEKRTEEDPVLWEGLDAWRASGLPMPKGAGSWQERASKPQTQRRFLSEAQQASAHSRAESPDSPEVRGTNDIIGDESE